MLFNASILYTAFSLSLRLRLSTKVLYILRSGSFPTIFHFSLVHTFSDRLNTKLHIIVPIIPPGRPPTAAHINVGSPTNVYLTGSASHLLVSFIFILAVTPFFTISGDFLASSTRSFIPGTSSSIWFSVSSSQLRILFAALSFTWLSFFNISFRSVIASAILLYHESILRRSSVPFCSSRNLLKASLSEFSNALLRHSFPYVSSFHFNPSLIACASASDIFSNLNCLLMKSWMYFICASSDGFGLTSFVLLTTA